jgi:hypothetical protein
VSGRAGEAHLVSNYLEDAHDRRIYLFPIEHEAVYTLRHHEVVGNNKIDDLHIGVRDAADGGFDGIADLVVTGKWGRAKGCPTRHLGRSAS